MLVGGLSSQLQSSKNCSGQVVAVFDLRRYSFIEHKILTQPLIGQPLLFNHTSICDKNAVFIYIFGGGSNCFSFGMHVNKYVLKVPIKNIIMQ